MSMLIDELYTRSPFGTLIEVLQRRSADSSDQTVYLYYEDELEQKNGCSYMLFETQVKAYATRLQSLANPGERCLIALPPGLDYLICFWACMYAGLIAVPVYASRKSRHGERLTGICEDCNPALIISDEAGVSTLQKQLNPESSIFLLKYDFPDSEWAGNWVQPSISGETTAFLQYTSGSTGAPKGVVVTHANVLHNCGMIARQAGLSRGQSIVSWLPFYHDMGLIGNIILAPVHGLTCILMSPLAFLKQPLNWLCLVSEHRAYYSGGPNFAYDLCVKKLAAWPDIQLDLSHWKVAYNGAEPVRLLTMERFANAFQSFGLATDALFSAYGMAEATLSIATTSWRGGANHFKVSRFSLEKGFAMAAARDEPSYSLVGTGSTIHGQKLVIADPQTCVALPEGQVGEIWLQGESVANGYWNKPELNSQIFNARLADSGEGPFLRTGDLGFIYQSQLYITGRLKDLIIINGRNHYPQDIELSVQRRRPELMENSGAAFALESEGGEQLVIVQEVVRERVRNLASDEILDALLECVFQEHEVTLSDIVLVMPGDVPRTSSGKVQRSKARQLYLNDGFRVIARLKDRINDKPAEKPESENQAISFRTFLVNAVSDLCAIPEERVDIHRPFSAFGLSSMNAVELAQRLSRFCGRDLTPTLAYDYPNIHLLAGYLSGSIIKDEKDLPFAPATGNLGQVAVIGMSCRFPGASTVQEFWSNLLDGVDSISNAGRERSELSGSMNEGLSGGFISDPACFDASFFNISPREAAQMDPQQRIILEQVWHALEDAFIAPSSLRGKRVGVFVGISTGDYGQKALGGIPDMYAGTGNAFSVAANRVSFYFDWRGPSLAIDTACSSSSVAFHTAVSSLRNGDCDWALVGGVNLIFSNSLHEIFSKAGMLSPTDSCKTFDTAADGYVRGEGCGFVVLQRTNEARAAGNRIRAIVRGTAINQDGRSNGLTAPNKLAQQEVIRMALDAAGADGADLGYIETHGTGTPLGDPIEVNALAELMMGNPENPCFLGAVKTNIGHLESAAGIAGLIKTILVVEQGLVPANLHFKTLNPYIKIEGSRLKFPVQAEPWKSNGKKRLAGVSSFGFGGANAHVILEEADGVINEPAPDIPLVAAFSARTPEALRMKCKELVRRLTGTEDIQASAVFNSITAAQEQMEIRKAWVFSGVQDLIHKLNDFTAIEYASIEPGPEPEPFVVFGFSGQGSQYTGMARKLFDSEPLFRERFTQCSRIFSAYFPITLEEILFGGDPELIHQTQYTQPALFALEYALACFWMDMGIKPAALAGHSLGEYVAACIAGIFSLEDAIRLVAKRAMLMQAQPAIGAMYSIMAGEKELIPILNDIGTDIDIAAFNGPDHIVLSGAAQDLEHICLVLKDKGIHSRKLPVSHAFHSRLMKPVIASFREELNTVKFYPASIPIISNLTGLPAGASMNNPDYWCEHILKPVRFLGTMKTLKAAGMNIFVEIGPQPQLMQLGKTCLENAGCLWIPSMRKTRDDGLVLQENLAILFTAGIHINWKLHSAYRAGNRLNLGHYPFERSLYWLPALGRNTRPGFQDRANEIRLNRVITASQREYIFQTTISLRQQSYLEDHRVHGFLICPASVYVDLIYSAIRLQTGSFNYCLRQFKVLRPLLLDVSGEYDLQLILSKKNHSDFEAGCYWFSDGEWNLLVSAELIRENQELTAREADREAMPFSIEGAGYYKLLMEKGLSYGEAFQGIRHLKHGEEQAEAWIELPLGLEEAASQSILHPVLLDAAFQAVGAVLPKLMSGQRFIFSGFSGIRIMQAGAMEFRVLVKVDSVRNDQGFTASLSLFDREGGQIAVIDSLQILTLPDNWSPVREEASRASLFYRQVWKPSYSSAGLLHSGQMAEKDGDPFPLFTLPDPLDVIAYRPLVEEMDELACSYAIRALANLGWHEERLTAEDAILFFKIVPEYHLLFHRILEIAVDKGFLDFNGHYKLKKNFPSVVLSEEDLTDLNDRYPGASEEIQLLVHCGNGLSAALRGQVKGVELVFPGGNEKLVTKLYQDTPVSVYMNRVLAAAIETVLKDVDPDKPVRILELGAGTGSTTSYILPMLENYRVNYVFTDISTVFLQKAKQRFAGFSGIEYRILNMEEDPQVQGFEPCEFDLVIASNVLHATADIRHALAYMYRLVKPCGYAFIWEGFGKQAWLDVIFGLTDGWWRFKDTDLRTDYPLLEREQWTAILKETGFNVSAVLHPGEAERSSITRQGVILGYKSADNLPVLPEADSDYWLLLSDSLSVRQKLTNVWSAYYCRIECPSITMRNDCLAELNDFVSSRQGRVKGLLITADWLDDLKVEGYAHSFQLLVQWLVNLAGMSREIKMILVTRATAGISGSEEMLNAKQALLTAIMKSAGWEYAKFNGSCIDIGMEATDNEWVQAVTETAFSSDREHLLAYRNGQRYICRLEEFSPGADRPLPLIDADLAYIVSGGTGGLGWLAVRWLIRQGAFHVYLPGRRAYCSEEQLREIDDYSARGIQIHLLKCDVTVAGDVEFLSDSIQKHGLRVGGIIHAAGVHHYEVFEQLTKEAWNQAISAKVQGAQELGKLIMQAPQAFFILFSSTTSLWGGKGLAAYTAANQFLDVYANELSRQGHIALSVNWGPWQSGMLSHDEKLAVAQSGLHLFEDQAMDELTVMLQSGISNIVCVNADWNRFGSLYAEFCKRPFLDLLIQDTATQRPGEGKSIKPDLQKWHELSSAGQQMDLRSYLLTLLADSMQLDPDTVDPNISLQHYGLDSLVAMEIRNRIGLDWGIEPDIALLMQGASLCALEQSLLLLLRGSGISKIGLSPLATDALTSLEARRLLENMESLNEEEINALLSILEED